MMVEQMEWFFQHINIHIKKNRLDYDFFQVIKQEI